MVGVGKTPTQRKDPSLMSTRPIKFRIWDKELKQMECLRRGHRTGGSIYNALSFNDKTGEPEDLIMLPEYEDPIDYEPLENRYVLMQFTGLKDKNGVEIFEGDIVKCWYGHKGVVKWGYFGFEIDELDNSFHHTYEKAEVIGNIYENKELLK